MTGPNPASGQVDGLLVVAATAAEAAHVPADVEVLITGIGKTAAAAGLARHLARREARRDDLAGLTLLNIGTAGALRPGISGLLEPGIVVNHDFSAEAVRALGYDPRERLEVGTGDPGIVLASGDTFVTDGATRDGLARTAALVDMEAYAVAFVAADFGVPLRLAKHISDEADESALAWNEVVDLSARVLGEWVARVA